MSSWTALAQGDLKIGPVFDGKIVPQKNMKETFIRSSQLEPYNLKLYHSVSFIADDEILNEVSCLVLDDADKAIEQEIHMNGGLLVYAILTFESGNHENRFVCYKCSSKAGSHAITLVYMSGPATLDDLKKLFRTPNK